MNKIVQELVKHNIIDKNRTNTYKYGLEVLKIKFIVLTISIILGCVFKSISVLFLFLVLFVPLRRYAGGIHANNKYVCMSLSIIILLLVQIGYKYIILDKCFSSVIVTLGTIIVVSLSPGESKNHILNVEQYKKYRYMSMIFSGINVVCFIVSLCLELSLLQYVSCTSLLIQELLLIPLLFMNKRNRKLVDDY